MELRIIEVAMFSLQCPLGIYGKVDPQVPNGLSTQYKYFHGVRYYVIYTVCPCDSVDVKFTKTYEVTQWLGAQQ